MRIHFGDAGFHPRSRRRLQLHDLRCGSAVDRINREGAGVAQDDPREIPMKLTKVLGLAAVGALLSFGPAMVMTDFR
jgi:hypothetical protein